MATGIILAGGKGFRFGEDKCLIRFEGRYLIERVIDVFTNIFDEIIISTNNPSAYNKFFVNAKIIKDLIPGKGPLVGIYSSLRESASELNFVSACDMPFIKPALIQYMIQKSEGYDVVVPSLGEGKLEPLHALYSKSCLPAMDQSIRTGKARIISFFPNVRVYRMEKEEIRIYDREMISFFNVNTKDDLKKAKMVRGLTRYF